MHEAQAALHALIKEAGLTPDEVTDLALGDLHLSDREPHIRVWNAEQGEQRQVLLSSRAREAIVAWMLARPDRPVPLLFPGETDEGYSKAEIEALLAAYAPTNQPDSAPEPPHPPEAPPSLDPDGGRLIPSQRPEPAIIAPPRGPESVLMTETSAAPPVSDGSASTADTPPPAIKRGWSILAPLLALLLCGVLGIGLGAFVFRDRLLTIIPATPTALALLTPETTIETLPQAQPSPSPTTSATFTPTPSPTATETPSPSPTAEPSPTNTPTPSPTPSPSASPTFTPEPTPTAEPTATATPAPQVVAPPPTATPTPGLRYPAPALLEPADDFKFITGNTIELVWEAVGELGADEQYAVRLIFFNAGQPVYRGAQLKDTRWTVPLELFGQADGPEFEYTWYVYIEQTQNDGGAIPVSPESDYRSFIWAPQ